MRVTRFLLAASLAAPLLAPSTGCEIIRSKVPGMNPADRLPPAELLVGGGRQIEFTAPGPGTVIYANRRTGRILKTQSVRQAERVSFAVDLANPDDPLLYGQDPATFDGVLYFRPEGWAAPAPPADADASRPVTSA